jgi:hypothetical protein
MHPIREKGQDEITAHSHDMCPAFARTCAFINLLLGKSPRSIVLNQVLLQLLCYRTTLKEALIESRAIQAYRGETE